jgi:3-hydroxyisobutyrate dehydrogenase-like beta-hydroxyacid dehydrogenase
MSESIGFIGLGNMGRPIATHLLQAGYRLRIYDIDPAQCASLVELGAQVVERPADAVEPGGIIFTMVPNDDALIGIVNAKDGGLLERLGTGIHVSLSTVSPQVAQQIASEYERRGTSYVGATVFGRPDIAAAGKLTVALSGPEAARERIRPYLQTFSGGRIYDFGNEAHLANIVKLIGNKLIVDTIESLASAAALLDSYGIDRMQYMQMMATEIFNCPIFRTYGGLIGQDTFTPALFQAKWGLKDINLILQIAEQVGVPLPVMNMAAEHLRSAIDQGWGDQDWSVLARVVTQSQKPQEK